MMMRDGYLVRDLPRGVLAVFGVLGLSLLGCGVDRAATVDGPSGAAATLALPSTPGIPVVTDAERDAVLAQHGLSAPSVALAIGDPAPPLDVDGWVGGVPRSLSPGSVYVVEMWATWCRPCVEAMPHLSDLAELYRDHGVHVIGVNVEDSEVSELEAFVAKQGRAIRYPNAYARGGQLEQRWLKAAGMMGLPATFVVDREGRLAWVGRPNEVDDVVRRVVGETWDLERRRGEAERRRLVEPVARRAVALLETSPERGYWLLTVLMGRIAFDDPEVLHQIGYHVFASPAVAERRLEVAASAAASAGKLRGWKDPEDMLLMARIRAAQGRTREAAQWRRAADPSGVETR